ncbi:transglycosylase domain-containing protein [Nonomuraea cavernae]|nr:transglycosylase domain-containing protein [Nonomuraea cavernae]MCA2184095.1 penicillin-binding protein [Nonomuraea cavernae]
MSAQPYEPGPRPGPRTPEPYHPGQQQPGPHQPGRREPAPQQAPHQSPQHAPREVAPRTPGPRGQASRGETETRSRANQETMVSDGPRRARGRGGGGGGGPQGPAGPGKPEGDKPRWRRFIPNWKIVMAGFAVLAAGLFGMIAVAYANMPVPTQDQVQEGVDDQGSVIYDENKKVLARLGVKRIPVTYDQVPRAVQDAVIAAENSSFRDDSGISFSGMMRSLWSTASGQQVQGASTITQQMARNYYDGLSQERSVQRKLKEIFVAVKLNKQLSKEKILEQYLNTIYFGRGAYGIGAAADAFFGKKVEKLTPEQGAYLAGRIQNPDAFDRAELAGKMGDTEFRYNYVIKQMALLDPTAYGALPAKSPKSPKRIKYKTKDYFKGLAGYEVEAVLNELKARGISREDVEKGGYKIYSTFNKELMQAAKNAVNKHTAGLPGEINATLAAVDPTNGRVRAFYGGDDYEKDQWNDAFLSQKQAASAFKPYVLAAWLDAGYSLNSYVPTKGPVKLPGTTDINNDHAMKASAVDVVSATAQSVNTAYAKMGEKVGLDKVIDIASKAGLNEGRLKDAESRHHYLITIGSSQVTAVEQAGGYSIFANGGKHYPSHVVIQVRDKKNQVVFNEKKTPVRVISEDAAADAVTALEAVVKQGTGRNAALYDRPVAGKTGTNNENKEAWFVGFTPQLSTAVGMFRQECRTKAGRVVQPVHDNCPVTRGKSKKYNAQNPYSKPYEVPLGSGFQGATYPAAIWKSFMTEAMKGQKVEQFPPRADTGIAENLAPKPVPTPTATKDPFPEQDSDEVCGEMGLCDDDQIVSIDPNQNDGVPQDEPTVIGQGQGSMPARPGPMPVRRENQ